MTLAQREHPEAVAEFDDAVRWYEAQEPGIGPRSSIGRSKPGKTLLSGRTPHHLSRPLLMEL